jgi:hypothetical protein
LRAPDGAASMIAMPTRTITRSAISLIAVTALLLCQAASWAGMRAPERLSVGTSLAAIAGAARSCHDLGGSDVPGNAAPCPCDSAQLPSGEVKFPVFAAAVLDVSFVLHIAPERELPPLEVELAHPPGVPPPLRLLHCRFRN